MTISNELFMAILSMDAYNRDYNSGIDGLNATKVGEASVIDRTAVGIGEPEYQTWIDAGFYAVAYNLNGQTVISYRGTDVDSLSGLVNEALSGYITAVGGALSTQALMAAEFYQAVTGSDESNPINTQALLTGHSLGGGLAGYIASLYHQQGVLFDNMAFEEGAQDAYDKALAHGTSDAGAVGDLIWQDIYNGLDPAAPQISDATLKTIAVTGEFLSANRLAQSVSEVYIDSYAGLSHPVDELHSISLLVSLQFAKDSGLTDWRSIGEDLWDAMFSEEIGTASSFTPAGTGGRYSASAKMMSAIAYSALDSGSAQGDADYGYVFGNTAIRALFDDADELGSIVNAGKVSDALDDAIPGLAEAIVQFAGLMAERKINFRDYEFESSEFHPEDGVLELSDAGGEKTKLAAEAAVLTLSVNQDLWKLGETSGNVPDIEIVGLATLVEDLLHQASSGTAQSTMRKAMLELYGNGTPDFSVTKAIGSVLFSLSEGALDYTMTEPETAFDEDHTSLFAAGDQSDTITGNSQNNMVAGADGDDTLTGGLGSDLLLGGDGDDVFIDSVTERGELDGRQNEDDIYIGSNEYTGLVTDFLHWLLNGTETDTVRYTAESFAEDIPETPQDESTLQKEGLRVSGLKITPLGEVDAIEIKVTDLKSGLSGTDFLVGIEKVELSDRPDELVIDDNALKAAILIDMGKSGRLVTELPEGETLEDNAFIEKVDLADYSALTHGINYLKGTTSDREAVESLDRIFQWQGFDDELRTIADYAAKGVLGHNDALRVVGADRIKLTDHDDVVISAEYGSIVETGDGNDKVWLTDGIAIADLSVDDRVTLAGVLTLYGGMRNEASESPYAWGLYGTSYGLNAQGDLIIRNEFWQVATTNADGTVSTEAATMYVLNWKDTAVVRSDGQGEVGAGGIFLAEYHISSVLFRDITLDMKGTYSFLGAGAFDLLGLWIKTMTGSEWWGGEDPLVLDLDGDGIELTGLDHSKARLDIDDDGYAEATGFVGKDDGVLVRDLDGDGKIAGSAEMFGHGDTSGFSVLAQLDGNSDGKIDAGDSGLADFNGDGTINALDTFDNLLVWQDANENHVTDVGELKSVTEHGITAISLAATDLSVPQVVNGNTVVRTSTFSLQDGTVRTIGDVVLHLENQNTTYVGEDIAVSQAVADLANLKGYGTLVSLHEAMSLVSASEASVRNAIGSLDSPDLGDLRQAIRPILTAWALGSPIKIDGQVVTSMAGITPHDDLAIIRKDGEIVDYAWGLTNGANGNSTSRIAMASGVTITSSSPPSGRADLIGLLDEWTSGDKPGVVFSTGTETQPDDTTSSYLEYLGSDGSYLRIYGYELASWSAGLVASSTHSLAETVSTDTVSGSDFSFYERFLGESLEGFFVEPDSASAGYEALTELLNKMDGALDLMAVRLAVQSGPLEHYFQSVSYSAETDKFTSNPGEQLAEVFSALLVDAEQQSDPVNWLSGWKAFFDIFLADYDRGLATQKNTYAFLVQNMLNATERAPGGLTLQQFAEAFGIPEGLIIDGAGEVDGTNGINIFVIDGDETTVSGGSGTDNYVIGKNISSTTIYDNDGALSSDVDTIRFSAHTAADIEATREGIDLVLTDKVSGQSIRVTNQFEGRWPGPTISDASFEYGLDQIVFADGSLWTKVNIAENVSKIDNNSTTIEGTDDIDFLQGGGGDDVLKGAGDTDVYRFGRGDGRDTIEDLENNAFRDDRDMLQFLDGIRYENLEFVRDGSSNDLSIRFKDSLDDQITIKGQFAAAYTGVYGTWYQNRIELFTFDNGFSLTFDQVANLVLDTYSTSGDDVLYGMNREDILDAGEGDDYMSGGNQSDTYLFGRGYGRDVIEDNMSNILSGTSDRIIFRSDISPEEIRFERISGSSDSIIIAINGADDTLTLKNQYAYTETGIFGAVFFDRIEEFVFTDGSGVIWSESEVAQRILTDSASDGDDHIIGFSIADVLDGGAGNDILEGGGNSDTYIFGRGYGHDVIIDALGVSVLTPRTDRLIFKDLNFSDVSVSRNTYDLIFTINDTQETVTVSGQFDRPKLDSVSWVAVDLFVFSDGAELTFDDFSAMSLPLIGTDAADEIQGSEYGEILDGGLGDDILIGSQGSDIYIFNQGYGHDTIIDGMGYVLHDQFDTVRFGNNINLEDLNFVAVGNDLSITHLNGEDSLVIKDQFHYEFQRIESFEFSDGTILDFDTVYSIVTTHIGTNQDEVLYSTVFSDTYEYSRGGGHDIIDDTGIYWGYEDRLLLRNLSPQDVTIVRIGNDVTLVIAESMQGAGDAGSVLIKSGLHNRYGIGVEQIVFDDGTVWTPENIRDKLLTSTAADEVFLGFPGDDAYYYNRGDGLDIIIESDWDGTDDKLVFSDIDPADVTLVRDGDDVIFVIEESEPGANDAGSVTLKDSINISNERGVESVVFADGTVWSRANIATMLVTNAGTIGNDAIFGTNVGEILAGGHGNDTLDGGGGNDSYVYARGDGHDTITETSWNGTGDQLIFSDIIAEDITLVRNGNDVTLHIVESAPETGDAGSVLITSGLHNPHGIGVEQIVFADGTVWTPEDIRGRLLTSTTGDEDFQGFAGDDTYYYARGGGHDGITESEWSGTDRLTFTDINPADVTVSFSGSDLLVTIAESAPGAGDTGSILVKNTLGTSNERGVERIVFADGTTWNAAQIRAEAIASAQTSGNDTITGFGSSDIYAGGAGDDIINGGDGDDTYVYARGDGNDMITEDTWSGTNDRLIFTDINPADVTASFSGSDLLVTIAESAPGAGDAGSILVKSTLGTSNERGMEQIVFADGTAWNAAQIRAEAIAAAQTSGNDTITGFGSGDTYAGGLGDDVIDGSGGSDVYHYARGDGHDTIIEPTWGGTNDRLVFADINPSDVTLVRSGNDVTLVIAESTPGAGNAGSIQMIQSLSDYHERGMERVVFADGTTWSRSDLVNLNIVAGTPDNDTLDGTSGKDIIHGGDGDDILYGGAGDDVLAGDGGAYNQVNYDGYVSDYSFRLNADGSVTVTNAIYGTDTLTNIHGLWFLAESEWYDPTTLYTNAGTNTIDGTVDDDTLSGTQAGDNIHGGEGEDVLYGGKGDDLLDGGGGGYNQVDYDGAAEDYTFVLNTDGTTTVTNAVYGTDTLSSIDGIWFRGSATWSSLIDLHTNGWVANADTVTATAGVEVVLNLTANDTIAAGSNVVQSIWTEPENGSVYWDAGRNSFVYMADSGFTGTDTLEYILKDGNNDEAAMTEAVSVSITVTAPAPNQGETVSVGTSNGHHYFGGTSLDDTIIFTGGNETYVNAGDGDDIMVFSGSSADYEILGQGEHFVISHLTNGDSIQFTGTERFGFSDGIISLDDIIANSEYAPGDHWFEPEPIGGLV